MSNHIPTTDHKRFKTGSSADSNHISLGISPHLSPLIQTTQPHSISTPPLAPTSFRDITQIDLTSSQPVTPSASGLFSIPSSFHQNIHHVDSLPHPALFPPSYSDYNATNSDYLTTTPASLFPTQSHTPSSYPLSTPPANALPSASLFDPLLLNPYSSSSSLLNHHSHNLDSMSHGVKRKAERELSSITQNGSESESELDSKVVVTDQILPDYHQQTYIMQQPSQGGKVRQKIITDSESDSSSSSSSDSDSDSDSSSSSSSSSGSDSSGSSSTESDSDSDSDTDDGNTMSKKVSQLRSRISSSSTSKQHTAAITKSPAKLNKVVVLGQNPDPQSRIAVIIKKGFRSVPRSDTRTAGQLGLAFVKERRSTAPQPRHIDLISPSQSKPRGSLLGTNPSSSQPISSLISGSNPRLSKSTLSTLSPMTSTSNTNASTSNNFIATDRNARKLTLYGSTFPVYCQQPAQLQPALPTHPKDFPFTIPDIVMEYNAANISKLMVLSGKLDSTRVNSITIIFDTFLRLGKLIDANLEVPYDTALTTAQNLELGTVKSAEDEQFSIDTTEAATDANNDDELRPTLGRASSTNSNNDTKLDPTDIASKRSVQSPAQLQSETSPPLRIDFTPLTHYVYGLSALLSSAIEFHFFLANNGQLNDSYRSAIRSFIATLRLPNQLPLIVKIFLGYYRPSVIVEYAISGSYHIQPEQIKLEKKKAEFLAMYDKKKSETGQELAQKNLIETLMHTNSGEVESTVVVEAKIIGLTGEGKRELPHQNKAAKVGKGQKQKKRSNSSGGSVSDGSTSGSGTDSSSDSDQGDDSSSNTNPAAALPSTFLLPSLLETTTSDSLLSSMLLDIPMYDDDDGDGDIDSKKHKDDGFDTHTDPYENYSYGSNDDAYDESSPKQHEKPHHSGKEKKPHHHNHHDPPLSVKKPHHHNKDQRHTTNHHDTTKKDDTSSFFQTFQSLDKKAPGQYLLSLPSFEQANLNTPLSDRFLRAYISYHDNQTFSYQNQTIYTNLFLYTTVTLPRTLPKMLNVFPTMNVHGTIQEFDLMKHLIELAKHPQRARGFAAGLLTVNKTVPVWDTPSLLRKQISPSDIAKMTEKERIEQGYRKSFQIASKEVFVDDWSPTPCFVCDVAAMRQQESIKHDVATKQALSERKPPPPPPECLTLGDLTIERIYIIPINNSILDVDFCSNVLGIIRPTEDIYTYTQSIFVPTFTEVHERQKILADARDRGLHPPPYPQVIYNGPGELKPLPNGSLPALPRFFKPEVLNSFGFQLGDNKHDFNFMSAQTPRQIIVDKTGAKIGEEFSQTQIDQLLWKFGPENATFNSTAAKGNQTGPGGANFTPASQTSSELDFLDHLDALVGESSAQKTSKSKGVNTVHHIPCPPVDFTKISPQRLHTPQYRVQLEYPLYKKAIQGGPYANSAKIDPNQPQNPHAPIHTTPITVINGIPTGQWVSPQLSQPLPGKQIADCGLRYWCLVQFRDEYAKTKPLPQTVHESDILGYFDRRQRSFNHIIDQHHVYRENLTYLDELNKNSNVSQANAIQQFEESCERKLRAKWQHFSSNLNIIGEYYPHPSGFGGKTSGSQNQNHGLDFDLLDQLAGTKNPSGPNNFGNSNNNLGNMNQNPNMNNINPMGGAPMKNLMGMGMSGPNMNNPMMGNPNMTMGPGSNQMINRPGFVNGPPGPNPNPGMNSMNMPPSGPSAGPPGGPPGNFPGPMPPGGGAPGPMSSGMPPGPMPSVHPGRMGHSGPPNAQPPVSTNQYGYPASSTGPQPPKNPYGYPVSNAPPSQPTNPYGYPTAPGAGSGPPKNNFGYPVSSPPSAGPPSGPPGNVNPYGYPTSSSGPPPGGPAANAYGYPTSGPPSGPQPPGGLPGGPPGPVNNFGYPVAQNRNSYGYPTAPNPHPNQQQQQQQQQQPPPGGYQR